MGKYISHGTLFYSDCVFLMGKKEKDEIGEREGARKRKGKS